MNTTAALRGWTERGLHTVLLPTGQIIRLRLPSIEHLLRKGAFPQELVPMAVRFTMERIAFRDLDEESRERFLQMRDHLIAWCVQDVLVKGSGEPSDPENAWEELDLSPYLLDLSTVLPAEDLDALGYLAIRYKTPQTITAESKIRLGLARVVAGRMAEEGAAPAAADFRGVDTDAVGSPDRGDGQDVQLPTELGDRDNGSGSRASGRPGALSHTREG